MHRFIDTPILNAKFKAAMLASGADVFALEEDAVKALLKISTDTTVHGMCFSSPCLRRNNS
jgi:hypothetical protein